MPTSAAPTARRSGAPARERALRAVPEVTTVTASSPQVAVVIGVRSPSAPHLVSTFVRAGFTVVGVDTSPHEDTPGDALFGQYASSGSYVHLTAVGPAGVRGALAAATEHGTLTHVVSLAVPASAEPGGEAFMREVHDVLLVGYAITEAVATLMSRPQPNQSLTLVVDDTTAAGAGVVTLARNAAALEGPNGVRVNTVVASAPVDAKQVAVTCATFALALGGVTGQTLTVA